MKIGVNSRSNFTMKRLKKPKNTRLFYGGEPESYVPFLWKLKSEVDKEVDYIMDQEKKIKVWLASSVKGECLGRNCPGGNVQVGIFGVGNVRVDN